MTLTTQIHWRENVSANLSRFSSELLNSGSYTDKFVRELRWWWVVVITADNSRGLKSQWETFVFLSLFG